MLPTLGLVLVDGKDHQDDPPQDSDLPHEGWFFVRARSSDHAHALREALQVEAGDPLGGAHVEILGEPNSDEFKIHVRATDLVHLRAATNSFLKWLQAADASVEATR